MIAGRMLGRSGIPVSPLGLGCRAIGGPFWMNGKADGWGGPDDGEAIRAIRQAVSLGITFFDTSDIFGAGHSETVLGAALEGIRSKVVIATKFGNTFDEKRRIVTGQDASPAYIRKACEASLKRLGTDYIDLYQFHIRELSASRADEAADMLDRLVAEGSIRSYGWSTDDLEIAGLLVNRPGFTSVRHTFNVFERAPDIRELCERENLAGIIGNPLVTDILGGTVSGEALASPDDFDGRGNAGIRFIPDGVSEPEFRKKLGILRELLVSGGRTPVQGALGWIWGRSTRAIPVPDFRTAAQVIEDAGGLELGPLDPLILEQIEKLFDR